jgi:hypothetical protein
MTKHLMVLLAFLAALCAPAYALAQTPADAAPAATTAPTEPTLPTTTTEAPAENPAETDPVSTATKFYKALRSGEYLPAFGFGLFLLIAIFRWVGSKFSGWFKTKRGGYVTAAISAFGVTLGAAFSAGEPFSWSLLGIALGIAWTASGGLETASDAFGWLRKLRS